MSCGERWKSTSWRISSGRTFKEVRLVPLAIFEMAIMIVIELADSFGSDEMAAGETISCEEWRNTPEL